MIIRRLLYSIAMWYLRLIIYRQLPLKCLLQGHFKGNTIYMTTINGQIKQL